MAKRIFVASLAVVQMSVMAATMYVDCRNVGKADMDGSEAKAFGTIQEAVNAIPDGTASDRSTILVLPGDYDSGVTNAWFNSKYNGRSRVFVDRKAFVTIRARDGKGTVRLYGEHDSSVATACGPASVRCIVSYRARGLQIVDVDLLNGATDTNDSETNPTEGAALFCSDASYSACLIGCTVSNCVAQYGIIYRGTCIRTLFVDNHGYDGGIARSSDLYSCILTRNVQHKSGPYYALCNAGGTAINCTVVGNAFSHCFRGTGNHIYNTVVSQSSTAGEGRAITNVGTSDANVTDDSYGPFHAIAPALGDFRLLMTSVAVSAGKAEYLDATGLMLYSDADAFPAAELGKDFFGNSYGSGSTIMAGAVNAIAVPSGGACVFKNISSENRVVVSGHVSVADGIYAFATDYPTQWKVLAILPAGTNLFGYAYKDGGGNDSSGGRYRFPQMDGSVWMTPPADTSLVVTNTLETSLTELWVDPLADDSTATGSRDNPYGKLKSAAAAVQGKTRAIVRLMPGTYAAADDYEFHWGMNCRLWIPGTQDVRWIGEVGETPVRIEGCAATNPVNAARPGCGEDAMRILAVYGGNVQFQNITFANGYTLDAANSSDGAYGGLSYHNGSSIQFHDCMITNCGGAQTMVSPCLMVRCHVLDCCPGQKVMQNSGHAFASYFHNVRTPSSSSYNPFSKMSMTACTVVDDQKAGKYGLVTDSSDTVFACVMKGGLNFKSTASTGNVVWDYASRDSSVGLSVADPLLIEIDEPSIYARSGIWSMGAVPTTDNAGAKIHWYASGDIDGNSLVVLDGKFVPGARHTGEVNALFVDAPNGGISANGATGILSMKDMSSVEIAPTASTRPCAGFILNGVTNLFGSAATVSIATADVTAAGGITLQPVFTSDWHVAPDGDDTALGYTVATAFRTLTNAMAHAQGGDIVHAAAGVYAEGAALHDSAMQVRSRVVIKNGVSLVSDEGASHTVIEGVPDQTGGEYGCGPNAIRCVWLDGAGARIDGFTLRGGRTRGLESGNNHFNKDFSGGGVCGASRYATVENCVITNCGAYRGGGVRYATLKKCRIEDCFALYNSPAIGEGYLYGSLVVRNRGENPTCYDIGKIADCTFADNMSLDGSSAAAVWEFVDLKNGAMRQKCGGARKSPMLCRGQNGPAQRVCDRCDRRFGA